jgi:nucleoside-diphosphate-sugar epimerase
VEVPVTEEQPRCPISDYGVRKAAVEAYLLDEARRNRFPATVLHPGHLVGTGWMPLSPAANFNPAVFAGLAAGREIALPNLGRETLHHVHADDVAQAFVKAMYNWSVAVGECFHVVSPAAVSMAGYAEAVAGDGSGKRRGNYLGPHRTLAELQHPEGATASRLPAALPVAGSGSRVGGMACCPWSNRGGTDF